MEPGMVNGETESSTAGLKISAEEIQCQVAHILYYSFQFISVSLEKVLSNNFEVNHSFFYCLCYFEFVGFFLFVCWFFW